MPGDGRLALDSHFLKGPGGTCLLPKLLKKEWAGDKGFAVGWWLPGVPAELEIVFGDLSSSHFVQWQSAVLSLCVRGQWACKDSWILPKNIESDLWALQLLIYNMGWATLQSRASALCIDMGHVCTGSQFGHASLHFYFVSMWCILLLCIDLCENV